ncbi:MAG: site-specific integrase [Tannerellaceae bacterium]|jgi:integrase|nr:site-specific integrase [Tannerellaceae bacterium]
MTTKKKATANTKKEPVRLRERLLPSGNTTLYLDIYRDGKREYEYLKLYIVPEKTPIDKAQNKETLATAQAIKAKRQIELQNGEYGFTSQFKLDTLFLEYYRKMCEDRHGNPESRGNWGNWYSCLRHLERYCTEKTTFKDVTTDWIDGFKDYLDNAAKDAYKRKNNDLSEAKPLSQNSKVSYFNKLRACINKAFENRIIPINPLRGVSGFKDEETERTYLTFDEIKKMAKTECKYPALKRAFMFSCLTGLRKSDIEKMIWEEVQTFGDQTRIIFKQKKTGGQEYLDINTQAADYLGERRKNTDRVFVGFKYNSQTLLELRRWALLSCITKDFTFHAGRHTFAVMMLDLGTDIYTVSKLLGHKELSTTQIYAKVLDKKKQEAVNLIPSISE